MMNTLRRFVSSTTGLAEAVACVLVAAGWKLGASLARLLVFVPAPAGQNPMFNSRLDLHDHLEFAKYVLTLLPVLGFLLASVRGYVRGRQAGCGDFLILSGIVIAAAGTAAALDMLLVHHFWRSALAEGMTPLVHVDTLNHWHWALYAALPTALALGIREVRS